MTKSRRSPEGIALIAVLWMVAAMSIIAAGIVHSVRGEIRSVTLQRQVIGAVAQADAAILLALQNLHEQSKATTNATEKIVVEFEGGQYGVTVESLNGRIDINSAPLTLLVDLYTHAGQLTPQAARVLAQATMDTRSAKNSKGERRNFEAVEDLLGVPQMTYDLYARLNALITADVISGSGRVNPKAAPLGVLVVLAGGNAARAGDFAAQRDSSQHLMDTSFFDPSHIEALVSASLRFEVSVGFADGGSLTRSWHVYGGPDPRSGLPWRVLSKQKPLVRTSQSVVEQY